MRAALLAVLTTACVPLPADQPCTGDSDCVSGDVCARNNVCLAPEDVHAVRVTWTIRGAVPDATSCSGVTLSIQFEERDGFTLGYSPVACAAGFFSMDRLPTTFTRVVVSGGGLWNEATIPDAPSTTVSLDLR